MPVLPPHLLYVWEVYQGLAAQRQVGFSPLPISYSDILSYYQLYGVPQYDWRDLTNYIRIIDAIFLKLLIKNKGKAKGKKNAVNHRHNIPVKRRGASHR